MCENVNKLHPYIEKELEGIETYDRVILYGKAGRSMAIERPFILDEPITTGNMSECEVKEIRPLLFQITKGGNKWLVGSKNFPDLTEVFVSPRATHLCGFIVRWRIPS